MNPGEPRKLKDHKKTLRKTVGALLDGLPEDTRKEETARVRRLLAGHPAWRRARVILGYVSYPPEFDTQALLQAALEEGKLLGLPRLSCREARLTADRNMEFYEVEDLAGCPWEIHPFGMKEPPADLRIIVPAEYPPGEVLMITPGLAFDRACYRLGKGGGYYDSYIRRYPGRLFLAAPVFSCQLVPEIPREDHDQPVDLICSPEGCFSRS